MEGNAGHQGFWYIATRADFAAYKYVAYKDFVATAYDVAAQKRTPPNLRKHWRGSLAWILE